MDMGYKILNLQIVVYHYRTLVVGFDEYLYALYYLPQLITMYFIEVKCEVLTLWCLAC